MRANYKALEDLVHDGIDLTAPIEKQIEQIYTAKRAAAISCDDAGRALAEADRAVDVAKAKILLDHADDPKALGTNETLRKAALDDMTAGLQETAAAARKRYDLTQFQAQLVDIEVRRVQAWLKAIEVLSAAGYEV